MDNQDRLAIEQLFDKLAAVERRAPRRDPEAEALIRDLIAAQPGAAYYMAQTIVAQEQALSTAQQRIEELEDAGRQEPGGFLVGIFGGGRDRVPPRHDAPREAPPASPTARPWDRPAGGGFLAGAAQTAMGVAGGVVLGNLLAGALFGHGSASADDEPVNAASESTPAQDGTESGGQDTADADVDDEGGFDSSGDFDAGGLDV
jgi:hypothetical protein